MSQHNHRLLALVLASVICGLLPAAPAGAAVGTGHVRLAHLSPDTPKVDVWLTSFRGHRYSRVFRGVGYGVLSPYLPLNAGPYTVAMRPAGAAKSTPPLLDTTLRVAAGHAYTVAGIGPNASVSLRVLNDDLSAPRPGRARIRVIEASVNAPEVDVSTNAGVQLASGATFPSTTKYVQVPAQRLTLTATSAGGGPRARTPVSAKGGAIYTVLVLDGTTGGLRMVVRLDAAGANTRPVGAVAAGRAEPLTPGTPTRPTWATAAMLLALLAAAGAAASSVWSIRTARARASARERVAKP